MDDLPKHPGAILRETILPRFGLNNAELARHLGVSKPTFNALVDTKAREDRSGKPPTLSTDLAMRLEAATGYSAEKLLVAQVRYDLALANDQRRQYAETISRLGIGLKKVKR